jgi:hypothetical protein
MSLSRKSCKQFLGDRHDDALTTFVPPTAALAFAMSGRCRRHAAGAVLCRAPRGWTRRVCQQDYFEVNCPSYPSPFQNGTGGADRRLCSNRLSAVTLEPLRSRAAHIVQLRSIAAVRQGGCNGSEDGQEIHPRFPTLFPHGCSDRNFRPTHGGCEAIMWNEPGGIGPSAARSGGPNHTAAIASISSRKLGLASPRRMHSVLAGGCPAK